MNYGKSNLSRRKKRISSKKRMKKKRVGVRLFKAFVLCILLLGIVGVAAGGVFVQFLRYPDTFCRALSVLQCLTKAGSADTFYCCFF